MSPDRTKHRFPMTAIVSAKLRGKLFRKYVALFVAVVTTALIAVGITQIWFSYQQQKVFLTRIQREQAQSAAIKISDFIDHIASQVALTTQLPWMHGDIDDRRIEAAGLLRQTPSITQLAEFDRSGHEQLRVSRIAPDRLLSREDWSDNPVFVAAVASRIAYGPIYFLRQSEPYITLGIAGERLDSAVSIAEINLKLIWDVISRIKIGARGQAYIVDGSGRLIAHTDISWVLRNTDLSLLSQVEAARRADPAQASEAVEIADDLQGRRVLTNYAPVEPLGWLLFVELPLDEAYAPLYTSIWHSAALLLAALALAVIAGMFLARRMIVPIEELRAGAVRIGDGHLDSRISIRTGDELEALGDQFNRMAEQLRAYYATLERKVEERTHALELANQAKSRFLATASHDLRQPLHALGLFAAQLRADMSASERNRIIARITTAVGAMNELFNALLDISKLDAGVLVPTITEFPIAGLLSRLDATFAATAHEKGLSLQIVSSRCWVRSDHLLLERILLNLVSNAIRYTDQGGVVVGCRRRGKTAWIEVWDSGVGIPPNERQKIFAEFYRLDSSDHDRQTGLGLGLSIVERLCRLLNHPIEVTSVPGKGSRFRIGVPLTEAASRNMTRPVSATNPHDVFAGKLIVIIDDNPLVLDSMRGLLESWGCRVVAGPSSTAAHKSLVEEKCGIPDFVISDDHLEESASGIDAIEVIQRTFGTSIPSLLITSEINPERLRDAHKRRHCLLHKPVHPTTLRSFLSEVMCNSDRAPTSAS